MTEKGPAKTSKEGELQELSCDALMDAAANETDSNMAALAAGIWSIKCQDGGPIKTDSADTTWLIDGLEQIKELHYKTDLSIGNSNMIGSSLQSFKDMAGTGVTELDLAELAKSSQGSLKKAAALLKENFHVVADLSSSGIDEYSIFGNVLINKRLSLADIDALADLELTRVAAQEFELANKILTDRFQDFDKDQDGKISEAEIKEGTKILAVDNQELLALNLAGNNFSLFAKAGRDDARWQTEVKPSGLDRALLTIPFSKAKAQDQLWLERYLNRESSRQGEIALLAVSLAAGGGAGFLVKNTVGKIAAATIVGSLPPTAASFMDEQVKEVNRSLFGQGVQNYYELHGRSAAQIMKDKLYR